MGLSPGAWIDRAAHCGGAKHRDHCRGADSNRGWVFLDPQLAAVWTPARAGSEGRQCFLAGDQMAVAFGDLGRIACRGWHSAATYRNSRHTRGQSRGNRCIGVGRSLRLDRCACLSEEGSDASGDGKNDRRALGVRADRA